MTVAKITAEITAQKYELILDQIGVILTTELAKQFELTKDVLFNCGVWKERAVVFDKTEIPAVNIYYESSDYDQNDPNTSRGENKYIIEVNTSAKSTDTERGDEQSSILANKLAGVVRYILESPHYLRLGFDVSPAFIYHTRVESIRKSQPTDKDGAFNTGAQISFIVMANEYNGDLSAVTAEGYTTQVKIDETDKGHKFIINN